MQVVETKSRAGTNWADLLETKRKYETKPSNSERTIKNQIKHANYTPNNGQDLMKNAESKGLNTHRVIN